MAKVKVVSFTVSCDFHEAKDPKCKGVPQLIGWTEYNEATEMVRVDPQAEVKDGEEPEMKEVTILDEDGTPKLFPSAWEGMGCDTVALPLIKAAEALKAATVAKKDSDGDWTFGKHPILEAPTKTKGTQTAIQVGKASEEQKAWDAKAREWGVPQAKCKDRGRLSADFIAEAERHFRDFRPTE